MATPSKTKLNRAIAQANTATATKMLSLMRQFVNRHWQRATTPAEVQKRFLSANQRLLKQQFKHDENGYVGDEQLGRWCPLDYDEMPCAALKISNGTQNNLPFSYDPISQSFFVYGTGTGRTVAQWAKEYKVHLNDQYTIVFITLRRTLMYGYPESYQVHPCYDEGTIRMTVRINEKNDFRKVNTLNFLDVFQVDERYADNFRFPIAQPFNLLQALGTTNWVIWNAGFGMNTVGAWAIVKTSKTGKSHSSETLRLVNQRLFGLSYINMINEYL